MQFFPPVYLSLFPQLASPLISSLCSAMPTIAKRATASFAGDTAKDISIATPQKRRLRSNSTAEDEVPTTPPAKWKSPRRCIHSSPKSPSNVSESRLIFICIFSLMFSLDWMSWNLINFDRIVWQGIDKEFCDKLVTSTRSPLKKSSDNLLAKSNWNPRGFDLFLLDVILTWLNFW